MKNSTYIEKKWMQFKVSTLSASITALVIAGIPNVSTASDIDIYQAGGTGAINIYFMLDASSSMWNDSISRDYKATSSKNSTFKTYTQKDSGGHKLTINEVGYGLGSYVKDGWNNKYIESPGGNYSIAVSNADKDTKKIDRFDLSTASQKYSVCSSHIALSHDRKIEYVVNNVKDSDHGKSYEFIYAKQGNPHCVVDVSTTYWNLNNSDDKKYTDKVKEICEQDSTNTNIYYCLSRLSNLKKGVMQTVLDKSINEEHNFAVGQYPKESGKNGAETKINFTNFGTFANKVAFINAVESISNKSSTPISYGYTEAVSKLQDHATNATNTKASCSGNGVYLLTDGEPNDTNSISSAINSKSQVTTTYWANEASAYWKKMAQYAIDLREDEKLRIKTATVGLGGGFYTTADYARDGAYECSAISGSGNARYDRHHQNLCYIGTKKKNNGMGGFYNAQSAQDIVSSIEQFVNDVSVPIEGSTMGTSTIPVDALNTTQLQPYSYFPMFKPLIGSKDQLWAGNLKKFKVVDGTIKDIKDSSVFKDANIQDALDDYWYSAVAGESDKKMAWGGHLSRLKVNHYPKVENSKTTLNRNLFINVGETLQPVKDVLGTNKVKNNQYLYGLLGFSKLKETDFTVLAGKDFSAQLTYLQTKVSNPGQYQMGSVIHSTPVLLTQKGTLAYDKTGGFSTKDREDYILFGTTQGVLHVVKAGQQNSLTETPDADGGKEVFSFVPKEFLERQEKGFAEGLAQGRTLDPETFFYGIDGPWVAHTEYEPLIIDTFKKDNDGKDTNEIIASASALIVKPNSSKSHQYVYGGLRMGGDSYYALNLSDMTNPKLMFHIDPAKYKKDDPTHPLAYMGQSWSKPTVTYIKWNGQRKLAMIVGGGYDMQYEKPGFSSSAAGKVKGNGVYIFDAVNGDLLWWGSGSASTVDAQNNDKGKLTQYAATEIEPMFDSIPSRVKAIDRDGDGITDHLYVGDLGGKLFRIDLNPHHTISDKKSEAKPFTLNAFQLADLGGRRIYEAPAFTIHKDGSTRYAVLTVGTGDRSNPLDSTGQKDYLVGIYDKTVTGLIPTTPKSGDTEYVISIADLNQIYATGATTPTNPMGWYFELPEKSVDGNTYQERVLEEVVALDNTLYVSMFNPQASTAGKDSTKCTGGITGESTVYEFCLPSGVCKGKNDRHKVGTLGAGILGLAIGPGSDANRRKLIFNEPIEPGADEFETTNKLVPQRWFEYSPYKKAGS